MWLKRFGTLLSLSKGLSVSGEYFGYKNQKIENRSLVAWDCRGFWEFGGGDRNILVLGSGDIT